MPPVSKGPHIDQTAYNRKLRSRANGVEVAPILVIFICGIRMTSARGCAFKEHEGSFAILVWGSRVLNCLAIFAPRKGLMRRFPQEC